MAQTLYTVSEAAVYIGDDGNGLGAFWRILEVTSDDPLSFNLIGEGILYDFGLLSYGVANDNVTITYNEASHEFFFRVAGISKTFPSSMCRDEIFQCGQTLAEIGTDRQRNDSS